MRISGKFETRIPGRFETPMGGKVGANMQLLRSETQDAISLYDTKTLENVHASHGRVERYMESYWHFSVRRFLYGAAEIRRLQEGSVVRNINRFSSLHVRAIKVLIEHFRWDLETMVAVSYDLKGELARLGINRQWHGPVGIAEIGYGGRKYKKQDVP